MIDGVCMVLVVISDVRVGDVVDLVYMLEGENFIFEGCYVVLLYVVSDVFIDWLYLCIEGLLEWWL